MISQPLQRQSILMFGWTSGSYLALFVTVSSTGLYGKQFPEVPQDSSFLHPALKICRIDKNEDGARLFATVQNNGHSTCKLLCLE